MASPVAPPTSHHLATPRSAHHTTPSFVWALSIFGGVQGRGGGMFFFEAVEIVRRTVWAIFRIEWEVVVKVHRASYASLPLNVRHRDRIPTAMRCQLLPPPIASSMLSHAIPHVHLHTLRTRMAACTRPVHSRVRVCTVHMAESALGD